MFLGNCEDKQLSVDTAYWHKLSRIAGISFWRLHSEHVLTPLLYLASCACCESVLIFYVYGSVHRWSTLITVQRDATQSSLFIILQVHSTLFGCQQHSSSGVHKTVTTASGTGHMFCTSLQRGPLYMFRMSTTSIIRSTQNCNYSLQYWSYFLCIYLPPTWPSWPRWREVAVITVLCPPDDGCGWHPKHVEWTSRIINRLLCFTSRWTVINIVY